MSFLAPPQRSVVRPIASLFALALLFPSLGCQGPGERVTPQRPTFTTDTQTTAVGTVELESGIGVDPGDSVDTPQTLKIGLEERTELSIGLSPYLKVERPGPDGEGISDLVVAVRHRIHTWPDTTSAAVQIATKLTTADEGEGLGSGEMDFFLTGILTRQFDSVSVVGNYRLGLLGDPDDDDADAQHALSVAAGVPVSGLPASVFGEVTGIASDVAEDVVFGIFGGAYEIRPSLVLDAAIVVGMNDDAPDFQVLFGFTSNFGRLFEVL
ncbi:MAG: transporter [Planctomycetota bacterium]